jgi:hypothetical protein
MYEYYRYASVLKNPPLQKNFHPSTKKHQTKIYSTSELLDTKIQLAKNVNNLFYTGGLSEILNIKKSTGAHRIKPVLNCNFLRLNCM